MSNKVIFPKEGMCPFCEAELILDDKERAGKIDIKCAECRKVFIGNMLTLSPEEGICPLCNGEIILNLEERSGQTKVKCDICKEQYSLDKMTFPSSINKGGSSSSEDKVPSVARASLIWGVLSLFFGEFILPQLLALILGFIALPQCDEVGGKGRGMAITGIVLGIIYLFVFIAIPILILSGI